MGIPARPRNFFRRENSKKGRVRRNKENDATSLSLPCPRAPCPADQH